MEKERLAEYLEQYHMGALNAATFWSWKYNNLISFRIPKTIC